MKRIISILLVALLLAPVAFAIGGYDLKGMTAGELRDLRNAVNAELLSRGIEKEVTVPAGTYIIGEDIPAGTYTIHSASVFVSLNVYDKYGDIENMYILYEGESVGKLSLTKGQTVKLSGSVVFAPYVGLGF